MKPSAPARTDGARLPAEERRHQLVEIGLHLLVERPIHELSLDVVAEHAGLSRSLLFHYFPTKAAYYAAVVQAAVEHLLGTIEVGSERPPGSRLREAILSYVGFVVAEQARYRALVRHAGGADPVVLQIIDDARAELARRLVLASGRRPSGPRTAAALAWIATTEELVLGGGAEALGRRELEAALLDTFDWMQERFTRRHQGRRAVVMASKSAP